LRLGAVVDISDDGQGFKAKGGHIRQENRLPTLRITKQQNGDFRGISHTSIPFFLPQEKEGIKPLNDIKKVIYSSRGDSLSF